MAHAVHIVFLFVLGACVGSFLNVVVWRVPRKGWRSLLSPPSHCPSCRHGLAWYDNVPVLGWIFLRGRCRYCGLAISPRYPIIEFITGAMFAFYYVMFFIFHIGPCAPMPGMEINPLFGTMVMTWIMPTSLADDWPIYALYMVMLCALLAASLIDMELYIIPEEIPWALAVIGILVHALIDRPTMPGALNLAPASTAGPVAAGGALGLLISIVLFQLRILPVSFPEGEPVGEIDDALYLEEVKRAREQGQPVPPRPRSYTRGEVRSEIGKEVLFLTPPLLLAAIAGAAAIGSPALAGFFAQALQYNWLSGMLGAMLGAMVGGLIIWLTRILGSLIMGRVAMGLGDIHLLFGIGAVIGAGMVTLTFFIAPFIGLAVGIWGLLARRQHELPYGPYLSLAAGLSLLIYCPVADRFGPGFAVLAQMVVQFIRGLLGG
jgi:leader peptidase (prepilin peptidase) / N-methyltransferase